MTPLLKDISVTKEGKDYIISTLYYVVNASSIHGIEELAGLLEKLSPDLGDGIMTLADRLRQEGKMEGISQGLSQGIAKGMAEGETKGIEAATQAVARRLLSKGSSLEFVVEITGLSPIDVRSLLEE